MLSLASSSTIRSAILTAAGVAFDVVNGKVDEEAILASLIAADASPRDIADALAEHKAKKGSSKTNGYVLGCDQILVHDGKIYGKPKSRDDLAETLKTISETPHNLFTAQVIYKDGTPQWRHVAKSTLTIKVLTDDEISLYIDRHWENVQHSAGGYHLETTPYLFSSIQGDWFDILGLSIDPILQLLKSNELAQSAERPKIAGVIGYPIAHSKSPVLHNYWIKQQSAHGMYTAIECPEGEFDITIKHLRSLGFAGANVTLPHKTNALAIADHVSHVAQSIGAANTLIFDENSGISAYNTDAYGFFENLNQTAEHWKYSDGPALVLGAGGAARAIIYALLDAGAETVYLTNRSIEKAENLKTHFGANVHVLPWDQRSTPPETIHTLVNTTSLGMVGHPPLDIGLDHVSQNGLVTDIVYNPLETDLLKLAEAKGIQTIDGLGMLLHQAVPGSKAWFGTDPQVDEGLRQAVLAP